MSASGILPDSPMPSTPLQERALRAIQVTIPIHPVSKAYVASIVVLAVILALATILFTLRVLFLAWLVIWHLLGAAISLMQGPYFIFHLPMAALGLVMLFKPEWLK